MESEWQSNCTCHCCALHNSIYAAMGTYISQLTSVYQLRGCCLALPENCQIGISRFAFIHTHNCLQFVQIVGNLVLRRVVLLFVQSILYTFSLLCLFLICLFLCLLLLVRPSAAQQLSRHLQVGSQPGGQKGKKKKKVPQDRIKWEEQSKPTEPTARNIICNTYKAAHTFTFGSFKQF